MAESFHFVQQPIITGRSQIVIHTKSNFLTTTTGMYRYHQHHHQQTRTQSTINNHPPATDDNSTEPATVLSLQPYSLVASASDGKRQFRSLFPLSLPFVASSSLPVSNFEERNYEQARLSPSRSSMCVVSQSAKSEQFHDTVRSVNSIGLDMVP